MQITDNHDLWERRERDMELRLKKLPVCCECGEYIQDYSAYKKGGLWTCCRCMSEYLVEVETGE